MTTSIEVTVSVVPEVEVVAVGAFGSGGGTFDGVHNDLTGRDTADAHPTSAVTGLDAALSDITDDVATNATAISTEATARSTADGLLVPKTTTVAGHALSANVTITASDVGAQPSDSDLTAIAALTTTAYGRAFLALANNAALRTVLGTGSPSSSNFLRGDGTWAAAAGGGGGDMLAANNLSDLTNAGTARTNLGLGTAATTASTAYDAAGAAAAAQSASQPLDSDLTAIAALTTTSYGRGLLTAANATALGLVKGDVGLGNVDNTADTAKPVSTAQATANATVASNAAAALAAHTGDTSDAHDASAVSVDSTGFAYPGSDVQAALGALDDGLDAVASEFADLTAVDAPPLRDLLLNTENMDLWPSGQLTQAMANQLAANVDLIAINRNKWVNYLTGMRATNPNLFIYAYQNAGEAQGSEIPGTYLAASAYAKAVDGSYVTNPGQGGNYVMNLDSSLWSADRIAKATSEYLPTTDADGIYLDVIGPGPMKWWGPSNPGSYDGRPVHLDGSGVPITTTVVGSLTNSQTNLTLASWPAAWPSTGTRYLAIYKAGDANVEIVKVTAGLGTTSLTLATRNTGSATSGTTSDAVAHGSGATVAWAWSDDEWMAASATLAGAIKTGLGIRTIGNGLGNGPNYTGAFSGSSPSQNATAPIIDHVDGGSAENFVRDATNGITTFKTPTLWLTELTMMDDMASRSKEFWAITKTWVSGTDTQKFRWAKYAGATFLLGYQTGLGFRWNFIKDHATSYNQAVQLNPYRDLFIGNPSGARTTEGSGTSSVYKRVYANAFVAVNPQTISNTVTLPSGNWYPVGDDGTVDTTTVSGVQTMGANTGGIWVASLTATSPLATEQWVRENADYLGAATTALAGAQRRFDTVTRLPADFNYLCSDAWQRILMDVSTSARDCTLDPTTIPWTDGDKVRVRLNVQASSRKVTIKLAAAAVTAGAVFDVADGSGWYVLTELGEEVELTWDATNQIMHVSRVGATNNPRQRSMSDSGSFIPDATYDLMYMSTVSSTTTAGTPVGSYRNGQQQRLRFRDTGSSSTLDFTTSTAYVGTAAYPLPTATTGGGAIDEYVFEYSTTTGKHHLVGGTTVAGSGGTGATNLAYTASPTDGTVTSDTGTDATVPLADGTNAGLLTPAGFTKLAGIEAGATGDQTAAEILTAIKTVDGAGSGLDADLLDGQSSAAFEVAGAAATAQAAAIAASAQRASNLSDLASAATARTNLGLAIGTNVQAYNALLAAIAGLTPTNGQAILGNGSTFVMGTPTVADPPTVQIIARQTLK